MRKRGTSVRVYSGASNRLRFQRTVTDTSGFAGIRADNKVHCQLFRVGDSYTYEPYERFDVVLPDESLASFGRIQRTGAYGMRSFKSLLSLLTLRNMRQGPKTSLLITSSFIQNFYRWSAVMTIK